MTSTPFDTLLIANRGEIATRIIRTARSMGLRTVAVYSDADAQAEHVRMADAAVHIGGAAPAESYLNIDRIMEAASTSGAGAIHPGYGFLAENPALAEACDAAGIAFVGPSADAIRTMGDKAAAKAAMEAAGVPCVPGFKGAQDAETLSEEANRIGYPVMIKATAGGGGRGMRLVHGAPDFLQALASAQSEARSAFGDATVLLEKAIENPRHIEIQIMADRDGNAVHLGERDCSVQRRHQKLIEEAPSPAVDADLRERMGAVSVNAARAIGYEGAGTFEYLLDEDGQFYFMEMNTRLQVEHPVTEAITGLDLVALQLRIAMGEPLNLAQDDVHLDGHAIEVRLCAEDAEAGFLPQSGGMARWRPSPRVRVDHALRDGADVPPFYDSMIAKVIARGPTRDAARRRLLVALGETQAIGVTTNQRFLADCLDHPEFARGAATTGFIETNAEVLLPDRHADEGDAAMILAALLRAGPATGLAPGFPTPMRLRRGDRVHQPVVQAGPRGRVSVALGDEMRSELTVRSAEDDGRHVFEQEGQRQAATVLQADGQVFLHRDGVTWAFEDLTLSPALKGGAEGGDGIVRASMNGAVVSVDVAEGDRVEAGQKVLVLEAMKMEHVHTAAVGGTVRAIHVAPGAQVEAKAPVIEIEPG